jgi:hypothetical protein
MRILSDVNLADRSSYNSTRTFSGRYWELGMSTLYVCEHSANDVELPCDH